MTLSTGAPTTDSRPLRRGVHVQIGIGTLLGWDDRPGELVGWGAVVAPVACEIVARQQRCEWRFAVHDDDGRLVFDGITRRRPEPRARGQSRWADGVVELHVPARLLSEPDQWPTSAHWSALLADLAAQYAANRPLHQDPDARFACRPQRRRTQTRYQQCIYPGCRRPARACDLDHRDDFAYGGRTTDDELAPACRHDHMNKTERGWRLIRLDGTRFRWISPLGRRHDVAIPPLVTPPLSPIASEDRSPSGEGSVHPFYTDGLDTSDRRTFWTPLLPAADDPADPVGSDDQPPPF